MNYDLLHGDGLLHRLDLLDDLLRCADGLGRATCGEPSLCRAYVRSLSRQVFFVASYAFVAGVVPIKVVMLGCDALVFEVLQSFFGFLGSLGAVHPQQGGGLVWR